MPIDTSFLRNAAAPAEFPSPYETYQKSLTLRELIDRRRQNEELRAHQRVQWQQAEEDRQRKMSLIALLQRNPKATREQIMETAPLEGMAHIKELDAQEKEKRLAQQAQRAAEETEQKVLTAKRIWLAKLAGSLLQEKDPEKRTQLFNKYTPALVETDMLTPEEAAEHMGDEPTIWKVVERGLGMEGLQDLRDKIAKAAREEELRGPALAKAKADATHAQQVATGTQPAGPRIPVPGVDVPYPPQVFEQRKDIAALRAPVPGTDVPLPPAVAAQRAAIAGQVAGAQAAARPPANQAVQKAKRLALDNVEGAIKAYRTELETVGPTFRPEKGARLGTLYRELQLQVKEMAGLGAITGPDEKILESIVTDPTGLKGNLMLGTKGLLEQLEALKGIVKRGRLNLEEVYGTGGAPAATPPAGRGKHKKGDDPGGIR